ncbi:hypothetical protein [Pseudoroseomonas ludipueritiae]|uniref:Uncharacterized protein n=1 Tax=Pseudoroseomonas ludipueritiae TaxID=198093 RepID=A0ABR7RBZ5_9PROT|nr:hypothetical protein [Pseudoroseomonas ludipueritiae]MBC9179151.1 hypothetical protein [Pseudoroseomonas ludipueritiae]
MVQTIKAAVDARQDQDFVSIALYPTGPLYAAAKALQSYVEEPQEPRSAGCRT